MADTPAKSGSGSQLKMPRAPSGEERFDPTLWAMAHTQEPEELRELRRRLLNQRDIASRMLSRNEGAHPDLVALHDMLLSVSSAHCFRRAPTETLHLARRYGLALLRAAAELTALEDACRSPESSPAEAQVDSTTS